MIELNKTEQMLPKHGHYNTDLLNICIYFIYLFIQHLFSALYTTKYALMRYL